LRTLWRPGRGSSILPSAPSCPRRTTNRVPHGRGSISVACKSGLRREAVGHQSMIDQARQQFLDVRVVETENRAAEERHP
jgi:hypothetical protein